MSKAIRSPQTLKLFKKGRLRPYAKGQNLMVVEEKEGVVYLKSGFIKRYFITQDGSERVQAIFGEQDIFSLTQIYAFLLDQQIYGGSEVYFYQAMVDSEVYFLDMDTLKKEVEATPEIYKELFVEAGRRLRSNIQRLENVAMGDSYARVAHQLVYFADNFGEETANGVRIAVPLTHQDIADNLSLTRETVSNCMTRLKRQGLIHTNRNIVIPDLDKLSEIAQG